MSQAALAIIGLGALVIVFCVVVSAIVVALIEWIDTPPGLSTFIERCQCCGKMDVVDDHPFPIQSDGNVQITWRICPDCRFNQICPPLIGSQEECLGPLPYAPKQDAPH